MASRARPPPPPRRPRRLRRRLAPSASPSSPSAPSAFSSGLLLLGVLLLGVGLLLERRLLDLRLDLVAQLEIPGVLVLGRELVAAAELAQLGGGDVELVRDPGIGAALADPGANLVEL